MLLAVHVLQVVQEQIGIGKEPFDCFKGCMPRGVQRGVNAAFLQPPKKIQRKIGLT